MLTGNLAVYLSTIAIFLISLSVHEYAHARVAYHYGDDTAARLGRLTLNPIAHISLFGTILLPLLVHFGWAKPVPVNFGILTRSQVFQVAAAGPAANLALAVGLALAFHVLHLQALPVLGHFVLLAILSNIMLAVFNLIPIPPLDGSRMVYARLKSPGAIAAYGTFSQFGMLILIGFLFLGGLETVVYPVVGLVYTLLRLPFSALMM
jgi:Zn-dependent protease